MDLLDDSTIKQPGFDLHRCYCALLNHFRTNQTHCAPKKCCPMKWGPAGTDVPWWQKPNDATLSADQARDRAAAIALSWLCCHWMTEDIWVINALDNNNNDLWVADCHTAAFYCGLNYCWFVGHSMTLIVLVFDPVRMLCGADAVDGWTGRCAIRSSSLPVFQRHHKDRSSWSSLWAGISLVEWQPHFRHWGILLTTNAWILLQICRRCQSIINACYMHNCTYMSSS